MEEKEGDGIRPFLTHESVNGEFGDLVQLVAKENGDSQESSESELAKSWNPTFSVAPNLPSYVVHGESMSVSQVSPHVSFGDFAASALEHSSESQEQLFVVARKIGNKLLEENKVLKKHIEFLGTKLVYLSAHFCV